MPVAIDIRFVFQVTKDAGRKFVGREDEDVVSESDSIECSRL